MSEWRRNRVADCTCYFADCKCPLRLDAKPNMDNMEKTSIDYTD